MELTFADATEADVPALVSLRTAVAERLTADFGAGHWSSIATPNGVLHALRTASVLVARDARELVGTLTLATKKPWAIDAAYFTPVRRPLYLTAMAVAPTLQRAGLGRRLLAAGVEQAREMHGLAIRLDAYDAPDGAGDFYAKCGFREVGRVVYRGTPLVYFELVL